LVDSFDPTTRALPFEAAQQKLLEHGVEGISIEPRQSAAVLSEDQPNWRIRSQIFRQWDSGCRVLLVRTGLAAMTLSAAITAVVGCTGESETSAPRPSVPSLDRDAGIDAGADAIDAGDSGGIQTAGSRICDGSTEVRFVFSNLPGGMPEPAIQSLYDLGGDFLYVDGSCHYWVAQPGSIQDEYRLWRSTRAGVLNPTQEAILHAAVAYDGEISTVLTCTDVEGAQDVDIARIWNGRRVYRCDGDLEIPPDWPLRDELYAAGAPVDGPVRIQLSKVAVSEIELKYASPLGDSPSNYIVEGEGALSFRIDEPDAVRALRQLREEAIDNASQTPGYFRGYIAILPGDDVLAPGEGYALAVRDELPFTDADGQWSPPR
jgi:hypothetical protein